MPISIPIFLFAKTAYEKEQAAKNVPVKPEKATQLGLIAALYSPTNGGLGAYVVPVALAQNIGRRDAEKAAADAAAQQVSQTSTGSGSGTVTPPDGGVVTRAEFNALEERVGVVETALADYPNFLGSPPKTVSEAQNTLRGLGFNVRMEGEGSIVTGQKPDPQINSVLAIGATVTLEAK